MITALPIPAVLIGDDEYVLAINAGAEGFLAPGVVSRHYITALRQPDLLQAIEAVIDSGEPRTSRFLVSQENRDKELVAHVSEIAGDRRVVLVTFIDDSHRTEAGQIRREFVANVSHELRTPLTAMLGFIETLRGAASDDPKARERFLGIMAREAERMNRLVRDLLHLSRVEAEELVRPGETVDVPRVVRTAVARFAALAEEKSVEVEVRCDSESEVVTGDEDQLLQAFLNLTENAIKYGGSGKTVFIKIEPIEFAPSLRGPGLRIDVTDQGEGIDPHHIPRLTERFYRVDNHRSREMGGTGLGLAIVKHIVGRHRGRMMIESEAGQGSTFSVLLPR